MENINRLDRVSIFGDKLSFLVPHDWVEEVDEDHYLYYEPGTDSGWLRVTLLTMGPFDDRSPAEHLQQLCGSNEHVVEDSTHNVVCASEKDSEEEGKRIHIYHWKVANVVPPDLVREALFSFTVLQDRRYKEGTSQAVKIIGQLVSQAQFLQ
jgi:hypothetical protein